MSEYVGLVLKSELYRMSVIDKQRRWWEGKTDHGRKTDLLNGPFYFVD